MWFYTDVSAEYHDLYKDIYEATEEWIIAGSLEKASGSQGRHSPRTK